MSTSKGLTVLDLANSYAPIVRSSLSLSGSPYLGYGIVVKDSYAYVASHSRGIHVVDIVNPNAPIALLRTTDGGKFYDLAVKDNTLYAADWGSGMRVYDITSPSRPILRKRIGLPSWKSASADAAWLPRLTAGMDTGNAKTTGVTVAGNRLVATEWSSGRVDLYDISSAQNPVFEGTHYAPFVLNSVIDEAADYIYIFGGYNSRAYSRLYSVPRR